MAIGVTAVEGANTVWGNKRVRVYDVAFSGTYTANGEVVLADTVGLNVIEQVLPNTGVVPDSASAPTVAGGLGVVIASDGSQATFSLYESAADGDPFDEKPAEAVTNEAATFRVTFIGY